MCAYSTSELCFSHSLLLLTEYILKWIDPFIRLLRARCVFVWVYVHGIDVRLQLRSSLSHRHYTQLYSLRARFSSCCSSAIYIKIYALFNHELVVYVSVCACAHFFLVDDYFFCVLLLFHLNGSQQKQNRFKMENVQFFKRMWMQSMDKLQCDEIEWAQSPLSNTFERWKDEATKKQNKTW